MERRITQILRDYLKGFKAELFVGFADTFRSSSDYTVVKDTVNFVNQYIVDDDFAEFPEVIEKLESGAYTKVTAARKARQIAKNAGADIVVNEGSGASPSGSSSSGKKENSDSDSSRNDDRRSNEE